MGDAGLTPHEQAVASDIYDAIDTERAGSITVARLQSHVHEVQEAMQQWAIEEDGYQDDISLVIVRLPCWGLDGKTPELKGRSLSASFSSMSMPSMPSIFGGKSAAASP